MRDEKWDTFTCPLGFPVMGIWPASRPGEGHADGTDINAVCRGGENQARASGGGGGSERQILSFFFDNSQRWTP